MSVHRVLPPCDACHVMPGAEAFIMLLDGQPPTQVRLCLRCRHVLELPENLRRPEDSVALDWMHQTFRNAPAFLGKSRETLRAEIGWMP